MDDELNEELETVTPEDEEQETSYEDDFDAWASGDNTDDFDLNDEEGQPDSQGDLDEEEGEPEPEGDTDGEPEPENVKDDDPWSNATEAQVSAYRALQNEKAALQHKFLSHDGRVNSMRSQIETLQSQLQEAMKKNSPTQQESAAPSSEELDEFKNEYPDIADAVDRLVNNRLSIEREKLESQLAQLDNRFNQTIQPFREAEAQRSEQVQVDALNAKHPDWRDVAGSAEFVDWLSVQPEPVRELYKSSKADDASWLLDNYKRANNLLAPQPGESNVHDELPVQNSRDKLKNNITPRGRRGAPSTGVPEVFEDAFEYYAKK